MIELLGGASALLLVGGVGGHAAGLLSRLVGNVARNWGTRGPLGAAFVAAIGIVILAGRQLAVCGSAAACAKTYQVLALPRPAPKLPPLDLTLRVDQTAAIFLLLVGTCGSCIAVYSFGWLRDDQLRNRVAGSFCLFLLSMVFVIVVSDIFWLFVALELMTFCSGDLVRYRGESGGDAEESRTAVRTYLIVSHVALISMLVGILPIVVSGGGTLDMSQLGLHSHPLHVSPAPAFSFSFILLGLAMRAGVTPFHFWVPIVHPQLPTNTHAMVSAVMLKIPVYLMIRFFLGGIVGPVQWWWGAVLLVLAGVTALVTVFYALLSSDLKVALAYHSVENIGIILAGLGLALMFSDPRFASLPGVRVAAGLALLASLYHVLNHGLFKTLLFLCVGSIERQTGTVDIRRLGGLSRSLPWTATAFMIGAAAIAELPPLNGFVSGWLTLQALFGGQQVYRSGKHGVGAFILLAVIVALVTLGLAIGATALAFLKITGQSLLGEPRGTPAAGREPRPMRTILTVLAAMCVLLGLQPWLLVPWLSRALLPLGYQMSGLSATPARLAIAIPAAKSTPGYHAALPILPFLLLVGVAAGLTVLLRAWRWTRRPVWVGGAAFDPDTMQYSGNAVSALLWEPMSDHGRRPAKPAAGQRDPRLYQEELRLSPRRAVPELANYFYNRLLARVVSSSDWFGSRFQGGDVRSYLLYMFLVVLIVVTILAAAR